MRFSQAGLQLLFVDLLGQRAVGDEIVSTLYLTLPQPQSAVDGDTDPVISFIKLVANPAPTRRVASFEQGTSPSSSTAPAESTVTLILGTACGRTFIWDINTATIRTAITSGTSAASTCAATASPGSGTCAASTTGVSNVLLVPWTAVVLGSGVTSVSSSVLAGVPGYALVS